MKKIVIAIDGFSSCGKSSFAKEIAKKYGYIFIDTGAMYRAITLYALRRGYISSGSIDENSLIADLDSISVLFKKSEGEITPKVMLCGEDVSEEIRTMEVSNNVSSISSIPSVRHHLVNLQQQMGRDRGVVMDGRDIGTVVFPDAELKIYMTASVDIRAERRYKELLAKNPDVSLEEIKQNIAERDYLDQTRAESPLVQAHDAIVLDNSHMTISEQMEWVEKIINEKIGSRS